MTVFENPKNDCVARDMMDALTILHDLGYWDEWVYKYADKPLELVRLVNEDRDALYEEWIESRPAVTLRILYHGPEKINFIKIMRQATGLGLLDTKILSESLPIHLPWAYTSEDELKNSMLFRELEGIGVKEGKHMEIIPWGYDKPIVEHDVLNSRYMLSDFGLSNNL